MATKRERILAAIKTTLAGTTGVGTRIYRSRIEPMARAESPALVVEWTSDLPSVGTPLNQGLSWVLSVRITVVVRGTTPDTLADGTIDSLHKKMVTDPTVGGLAIDVRPRTTSFEVVEADQPAGIITCDYDVEYRTAYDDLSA